MSIARRLASQSVFMFGLRVGGAGFIFFVQAAIARVWGAEALGDYLLVIASANLLAVVMPLGFQTVGTFFAAEYRAHGEGRHLRRFLTRAYGHVLVVGAGITLFCWPVTRLMGEPGEHLLALWVPTCLIGVAAGLIYVSTTILVGLKRPLAGYVPDMVFRPLLVISAFGIVAAVIEGPDLELMLWLLCGSQLVLAGVHFAIVLHAVRAVPVADTLRPAESRKWWRFAAPWVLITLASDYFFDINLLLLAGLLERTDLAIFGVSTRIFALIAFGIVAVYAMTLPDMYEADAGNDHKAFEKRVAESNLVATALAVSLFLGVLVFGRFALKLFGPEFVDGAMPLSILCLALVVRSIFGPASLVLSIQNRPAASLPSVALGIGGLVVGNFTLVPTYGLMGAAISALLAISLWSISLWLTAWHQAQVDVSIFNRFRVGPRRAEPLSGPEARGP